TYTYDLAGNRLTKRDSGSPTTYSYEAANQLLTQQDSTGRTTYAYDADGDLAKATAPVGGITTYTWDVEKRLTRVLLSTGTRNTFSYDGDGKRFRKDDSSGTTKFVWDFENILVETDGSDVTQAVYSLGLSLHGDLVSQRRSTTSQYFHFDGLGSTDRLTDSTGTTVTDNYVYQAFGSIKSSSGTSLNPFSYVVRL